MEDSETIKTTIIDIEEPHLDYEEKLYVRSYLSTLSHGLAYKVLNPESNGNHFKNKYSRRDNVSYHINKELQVRFEAMNLTEEVILSHLYEEATLRDKHSSHAARISALTTLGKHLGLFQEKKDESKQITYNIINYQSDSEDLLPEKKIEVIEEAIKPSDLKGQPDIIISKFEEDIDGNN